MEAEGGAKTNLFGVNFLVWFDIGIEGKDPMNQEEEDWGGKLEFGYQGKRFPTDIEDYFLLFEDRCSQLHTCAGHRDPILCQRLAAKATRLRPP